MVQTTGDRLAVGNEAQFHVAPPWGERHELAILRSAVRAIGEAIVITGPELDLPEPLIEYVNPGFERMTGYAAHEVVGRSPRFLQGSLTDQDTLARLRSALQAGKSFQGEAINYRKDGSTYHVEWLITPVLVASTRRSLRGPQP